MPGDQDMSHEAALQLVTRGSDAVEDGSVVFRHDPRLRAGSPMYATEGQILAMLGGVECKTLLLTAERGWPMSKEVVRQAFNIQTALYFTSNHAP